MTSSLHHYVFILCTLCTNNSMELSPS